MGTARGTAGSGPFVIGAYTVATMLSVFTANPLLTAAAVVASGVIVRLLWRSREPAVFLLVGLYQWVQASLDVFHADVLGVEMWTRFDTRSPELACALSLLWVVLWSVGVRVGMGPEASGQGERPTLPSRRRLTMLYAGHWVVMGLLTVLPIAGKSQIQFAIVSLRWGILYMIFSSGLRDSSRWMLLWGAFFGEIAVGWLGFFSKFKLVLAVMLLAAIAPAVGGFRRVWLVPSLVAGALILGSVWSTVKMEYRGALSGGTGSQSVQIGLAERAEVLGRLTDEVDEGSLAQGQQALLDRLAYITYFSHVLDFVPAVRPHEDGRLWLAAFEHVLTPRILFPDKPNLVSDTVLTERYTGLRLRYDGIATSISVGLPAENYVDLGLPWMFIPALLVGIMFGRMCRHVRRLGGNVVGDGAAVCLVLPFMTIEASITKLFGAMLVEYGALALLLGYFGPRLRHWLRV